MSLEGTLEVAVGEDAVFTFRIVNTGESPVELTFRSSKVADVVVRDGDEDVWRWSDGRMFAQMMNSVTVTPEETLEEDFTWENPPAGEYDALATLEADSPVEARASFTVE